MRDAGTRTGQEDFVRAKAFGLSAIKAVVFIAGLASSSFCVEDNSSVLKLGDRFFSDSLYNLAIEQYQKYLGLSRTPDKGPLAHFRIAQCYLRMGNMLRAAESFEEYIKLFPGDDNAMEAMFNAGVARQALGEHKQSSDWYYSVWNRFVGSALAQRALFEAAVEANRDGAFDRAIELFDLYIRRFPKSGYSAEAGLALAGLYLNKKDYAKVNDVLDNGEKQWSKDGRYQVRSLYLRARAARDTRKDDAAATLFSAMFKVEKVDFPEFRQACNDYIDFFERTGDYRKCLDAYGRLSKDYRRVSEALPASAVFEWAECARKAQDFTAAEDLYSGLLKAPDTSQIEVPLVRYRLAECRIGNGEFSHAIETLQSLAADDSSGEYGARAVLKIGDLYYKRELYLGAIPAYRKYLQLDGQRNKDAILYRIASVYQIQFHQYGTALREYENLLRQYPSSHFYHRTVFAMAQCYEALGRVSEAAQYYGYLMEAGVQGELVDKARERVRYLTTFRIKNTDAAVYALAEQTERILLRDTSESPEFCLARLAQTYEQDLKDHERALNLYKLILKNESLPDSVREMVEFRIARNCEYLSEKAGFEQNPQSAAHYKDEAVAYYNRLCGGEIVSEWTDDAAFRLMMLGTPKIGDFESFLQRFPDSPHLDEVLYRIARHYEEQVATGDSRLAEKALDAYGGIARRFTSGEYTARALLGIARNALVLGMVDTTTLYVGRFLERFPDSEMRPEALFLRGQVQKRGRDNSGAIETFKTVLYQYPFSSFADDARYELGLALFAANSFFEAADHFRAYLEQFPDGEYRGKAVYFLGRSLARTGRTAEALRLFDDLLADAIPAQVRAGVHYELARIAEEQNDTYRALSHYRQVLDEPSYAKKTGVYVHVGQLYFDRRLYGDAEKTFAEGVKAAQNGADSVECLKGHIKSLIMGGKGKGADKEFNEFQERYQDRPGDIADIIYHEGLYLLVEKKYDKARNRFRYVLSKYETTSYADDAAYQLSLTYYYDGDQDKALSGFNGFVTRYPQSEYVPLAMFKMGMIHHDREDFTRAAEYFTGLAEHPLADSVTRFRALYNAAIDCQKSSAWAQAGRIYMALLEQFPGKMPESSTHLKIGFCLFQANRFKDALGHFTTADKNPAAVDKPEILYWTGMCHAKLGNYQTAITELLKVPYLYASVGKWGVTAEFEAARLYERTNEFERARSLYKKIIRSDGEQGNFGKQALAQLERIETLNQ